MRNMSIKSGFLAVVALALLTHLPGAQAQINYQVGAQVCQYMNINQAKFLEYRSEGVLNTNTQPQWVVCPVAAEPTGDNVDSGIRIRNMSDVTAEAQCLWKLTNNVGNTIFSTSLTDDIPPGSTTIFLISNIDYVFGVTLTISCKLPPQTMAVSVSVEN